MALPAFAIIDDLSDRISGGVTVGDEPRAQAALDDASALIRAEAGKTWVTDGQLDADVPDVVVMVCLRAAMRAFSNPEALTAETQTLGDASDAKTYANASNDVYLTANERRLVRGETAPEFGVPGLSSVRVIAPASASASRLLGWPDCDDLSIS